MLVLLLASVSIMTTSPEIHPATEMVLGCVCSTRPDRKACFNERREGVSTILDQLSNVAETHDAIPPYMRLPYLAAYACGEGGFLVAPTCGADRVCYNECMSKIPVKSRIGKPRSKCIIACKGTPRCNDRGNSEGLFQLGTLHRRRLSKDPLAAFDVELSANYVLQSLQKNFNNAMSDCKKAGSRKWSRVRRWNVVAYRFGRGPTSARALKEETTCSPDFRTGETRCYTEPASKRIPRCIAGSSYVDKARVWWSRNKTVWSRK